MTRFTDVEQLSAYLDGQLGPSDRERLESRLAADASLRAILDQLRVSRALLRRVPRRKAPRNFTLNPLNARIRAPQPLAVPLLRYSGALASILFVLTVAINGLTPLARSLAPAPPGYGMGGGGPVAAEGPLESMQAAPAATPEAAVPAAPQDSAAPSVEPFAKAAPPESAPTPLAAARGGAPIPVMLTLVLALVGILLVGLSWYLDRRTRRNFHSDLLEK